jgi:hypothetical protein
MIRFKQLLLITLFFLPVLILPGCYTSTVDSLSSFKFQVPLNFHSNFTNKVVPDTSVDFSNLEIFPEYQNNKSRVKSAQVLSMNYWIDSLVLENNHPFDPAADTVIFDFIRFSLRFAVLKPNPPKPWNLADSSNFEPDTVLPTFILSEFKDVSIGDYYRNPNHIFQFADTLQEVISSAVRDSPQFYIITEYSSARSKGREIRMFPDIMARFDMIIRFEAGL